MESFLSGLEDFEAKKLDELAAHLHEARTELGLRGCTSSGQWKGMRLLSPNYARMFESFEKLFGERLDFDNLDPWLEKVRRSIFLGEPFNMPMR